MSKFEAATELLQEIMPHEDWEGSQHLNRTPERFVSMLDELTTPEDFEFTTFENSDVSEMVIIQDIPFYSLCAHHIIPFVGYAHIGYIPDGKVAGLSKFARLVQSTCRGLWVQEELTSTIGNILEEHLEPKGVAVVMKGEHLCYDDQTEVLTDDGWKKFRHLQPNDKVCQVDPYTLDASFTEPLDYVEYYYSGPMYYGKANKIDTLVTPDHRVLYKNQWKDETYHFNQAEHVWGLKSRVILPRSARFSSQMQATDAELDYARFMGIWMAEGSAFHAGRGSYRTVITQNPGPNADKVKELFDRLPYNYHIGQTPAGCLQFIINNKSLYDTMVQYKGSTDRQPEPKIRHLSYQAIQEYLEWYRIGDGDKQGYLYSSSKDLIDFTQELVLITGRSGTVSQHFYGGRQRYTLRVSDSTTSSLTPRSRSVEDYAGYVYCIRVPSSALLVRRNGSPLVSGNCMTMRGAQVPGTKTTTSYMGGVFDDHTRLARGEFLELIKNG